MLNAKHARRGRAFRFDGGELLMGDDFCGISGSTRGGTRVQYVEAGWGANHWKPAIDCHRANYQDAEHYHEDIYKADISKRAYAHIYWASPACPDWASAKGKKRNFDKQTVQQPNLFGEEAERDPEVEKNRALMSEVPKYLRVWVDRGRPVLAGVVENVVECRKWSEWDAWLGELHKLGYQTRVIAFNSMHADAPVSPRAPQSRDRLYVAYWHESLGRDPDWEKWLRPNAYCRHCDATAPAIQVFKVPGRDMGRYGRKHGQYIFVCPTAGCGRPVEPVVVPALAAIDPSIPSVPIEERAGLKMKILEDTTMDRIRAGIVRHWLPLIVPCGGTWRKQATSAFAPIPTRTTRESDGIVTLPGTLPFSVPLHGGGDALKTRAITEPLHTVTSGGNHHYLAFPPLAMRNYTQRGDTAHLSTPVDEPLRALTAQGNQSLLSWGQQLLVPYYGSSDTAQPAANPFGAISTRDRYGLAQPGDFWDWDVEAILPKVRFRMLEPHEVAIAMAFDRSYQVVTKVRKTMLRLYGNAVTPPVSELIISALVEAITGEDIDREYRELVEAEGLVSV